MCLFIVANHNIYAVESLCDVITNIIYIAIKLYFIKNVQNVTFPMVYKMSLIDTDECF